MKKDRKEQLAKLSDRIVPQIVFQSVIIIFVALISFIFMTWLVTDVFGVKDTYEAAGYELLGSLVILVLCIAPLNVVLYRIRAKEVNTLSNAIKSVASGNFAATIL